MSERISHGGFRGREYRGGGYRGHGVNPEAVAFGWGSWALDEERPGRGGAYGGPVADASSVGGAVEPNAERRGFRGGREQSTTIPHGGFVGVQFHGGGIPGLNAYVGSVAEASPGGGAVEHPYAHNRGFIGGREQSPVIPHGGFAGVQYHGGAYPGFNGRSVAEAGGAVDQNARNRGGLEQSRAIPHGGFAGREYRGGGYRGHGIDPEGRNQDAVMENGGADEEAEMENHNPVAQGPGGGEVYGGFAGVQFHGGGFNGRSLAGASFGGRAQNGRGGREQSPVIPHGGFAGIQYHGGAYPGFNGGPVVAGGAVDPNALNRSRAIPHGGFAGREYRGGGYRGHGIDPEAVQVEHNEDVVMEDEEEAAAAGENHNPVAQVYIPTEFWALVFRRSGRLTRARAASVCRTWRHILYLMRPTRMIERNLAVFFMRRMLLGENLQEARVRRANEGHTGEFFGYNVRCFLRLRRGTTAEDWSRENLVQLFAEPRF